MNASEQIDKKITALPDWRGELLIRLRKLIKEVEPDMIEDWKWETPVWSHKGIVCAVGIFNDHVKLNFFNGAALSDPEKLFNAGLDAKKTRAIDFFKDSTVNDTAIKELIRTAVVYNSSK